MNTAGKGATTTVFIVHVFGVFLCGGILKVVFIACRDVFMDMTKDNYITVKDQTGTSTEYKVGI